VSHTPQEVRETRRLILDACDLLNAGQNAALPTADISGPRYTKVQLLVQKELIEAIDIRFLPVLQEKYSIRWNGCGEVNQSHGN